MAALVRTAPWNGSHADIAREIEGKIPGGRAANQVVLEEWVEEYNFLRPNEAIGMNTPNKLYLPSPRKYDGDFDALEYPPGFLVRIVFRSGEIMIHGIRLIIGFALHGLQIGLRPSSGENAFQVFLADFLLGRLDMNSCCFSPLEVLEFKIASSSEG